MRNFETVVVVVTKTHMLTSKKYVNEQKAEFLDVSILWLSELHLLESLTDQFSVLEPFLIATLPVEFSQEGATEVRESYIRLRHK